MTNRLRILPRAVPVLLVVALAFGTLQAQQDAFNFSYPGPNLIAVGPTCSAQLAGNIGTPIVTSNQGGIITLSQFDAAASGYAFTDEWTPGTIVVWWQVADNLGNSASFNFVITFADTSPPVFDLTGIVDPLIVNSISQVPPAPSLPVSDNCSDDADLVQTFVQTPPPALCQGGTFSRTWTATDVLGNQAVFTQNIVVYKDSLPPQILGVPQNTAAPCKLLPNAYNNWLSAQMAAFFATDASGTPVYTNNAPVPFPPGCAQPVLVTFRATDQCGLTSSSTATFTTSDTQDPIVVQDAQDQVAACSPPGNNYLLALGNWISNHAGIIAIDSCPAPLIYTMSVNGQVKDSAQVVATLLASFANGCGFQLIGNQTYAKVRGYVRVDWFVDDACGNNSLGIFAGQGLFGVIDTVGPQILGPAVTYETCDANDSLAVIAWIENHGNSTLADDCSTPTWGNTFSWTTAGGQNGAGTFGAGPYPQPPAHNCTWWTDVTFSASDDCGNNSQRTLRLQIHDTIPPGVSGFVASDTLFCPEVLPLTLTAIVTDNCDTSITVTRSVAYSDSICSGAYTAVLTWTATDDCTNATTVTQTFVVLDTTRPVFTLVPASFTAACQSFVLPFWPVIGTELIASDICGTLDTVFITETSTQNPNPATCGHYTYTITRNFSAIDACGNVGTAVQIMSVVDNQPPGFAGFTDTTLVCEVQPNTPPPTAADLCSGVVGAPILYNQVFTAGDCADSYTLTLQWRATDGCNNTGYFDQNLHVQDTVKPALSGVPADIYVECDNIPAPPNDLVSTDNCDESVTVSFLETELRDPNPANCAHWTNYMIRREWTASDNCGNSRTYTQNISVQDNTGPVIVPQDSVVRPNEPGVCGATVSLPTPLALYDVCTSTDSIITLRDTVTLVNSMHSIDSLNTTPVDPVVFSWPSPNLPPNSPVVGDATLTVFLDNADAEGVAEFFTIYGEDGYILGQTTPTAGQCGSGMKTLTIAADLLNSWLTDGTLTLKLVPFGTGATAVNLVCANGRARANLTYVRALQQIPPTVTFSLDGSPPQPYPPATGFFLPVGLHTVVYVATDCAGNTSSASTTLEVEDHDPPTVTAPAPITAYIAGANCLATLSLPFPALSDNCGFSGEMEGFSAVTPLKFGIDPNAGIVAQMITLTVPNLLPNAVTGGVLKIRHLGDNAQSGEFFRVLDEQNMPLVPATNYGMPDDECLDFNESTLNVSAALINGWAADGTAGFKLVPNVDAATYSDFISPCGPLNGQGFDGISTVQATLTYNYAVVEYSVFDSGNILVAEGELTGSQTNVTLPPGVYSVTYRVFDSGGTPNVATFTVTVRDTMPPVAVCKPTIIYTHPSGAISYTLLPAEVNNGSSDNCPGNLSYAVSPSSFNCNQPASVVTLTVTDAMGNTATCTAQVSVQTQNLMPTVSPDICEGETVQFFANPPGPGNIIYSYLWKRPNGTTLATIANPTLPNASLSDEGTYTLILTGPTGCTAMGVVTLDLANLPGTPMLEVLPATLCEGQNVMLSTQPFGGSNVTYAWYTIAASGDSLLATTTSPTYQVMQPTLGAHQYTVKVYGNNCSSYLSAPKTVTVNPRPVASVVQSFISICEGLPLTLGTTLQGVSYAWTGPAWPGSNQQFPLVSPGVTMLQEGTYTLVVTQNNCASAPVNVVVDVLPKPPTPILTGATAVCAGDTVKLTAVPTQGYQFQWISPAGNVVITNINELVLPNVVPGDSGVWRVRLVLNGCISELSAPQIIQVQSYPQVSASQINALCQGSPLLLAASSNSQNVTFDWIGPDGFMAFNEQNPVDPTPASGTYKVTATTSNGCSGTDSVTVTVAPPPIVLVTNTAPDCADGVANALLQSDVYTEYPPVTYDWSGPGNFDSADPNPVIPAVSEEDNGSYTLIVTDANGCTSNPVTTVIDVEDAPAVPILAQPNPVCEGGTISLTITNPNNDPSVHYLWTTPSGSVTVTSQPSLTILNATMQNSGSYTVYATTPTCASVPSADVMVTVNGIPPAPTISTVNPNPCEGDTLQLIGPTGYAGYIWTGPNGFTATTPNPFIAQVDSAMHTGLYYLRVINNNCLSFASEPLEISVRKRPKQPIALMAAAVCLDQPDVLNLEIVGASAEPGAQFTWYNAATQQPLGPPTYSLPFQVTDFTGFNPGPNTIYVRATENGCSTTSTPITVNFDQIPNNSSFAGNDIAACNNQPLFLGATPPWPGTGQWTQAGGLAVTIVNPASNNSQIVGALPNVQYQFVWTLSAGACENYSSDTVRVAVTEPELAKVLYAFKDTCFATCAQIDAIQGQTTSGYWSQLDGQASLGVTILDPADPHTIVCGLGPGATWIFFWNLDNGPCGISQATVEVRPIGSDAYAGVDQNLCSNDSCTLLKAADIGISETGQWTSPDNGQVMFSSPNSVSTVVCGLQPGPNLFVWTTNGGFCGDRSTDSIIVNYEMTPTTLPETIVIPFGTTVTLDILANDYLPDLYRLEVVQDPQHGNFDQNTLTYQPDLEFAGTDMLRYRICNLNCVGEDACSNETIATLVILEADGCLIPTLITPNGDDYNDEFFIPCLPAFPDNEVMIFNQWGDQVFHAKPYANDWQGLYNGEPLPAGTYYFVVKFDNDKDGTKTGFLIIQR